MEAEMTSKFRYSGKDQKFAQQFAAGGKITTDEDRYNRAVPDQGSDMANTVTKLQTNKYWLGKENELMPEDETKGYSPEQEEKGFRLDAPKSYRQKEEDREYPPNRDS